MPISIVSEAIKTATENNRPVRVIRSDNCHIIVVESANKSCEQIWTIIMNAFDGEPGELDSIRDFDCLVSFNLNQGDETISAIFLIPEDECYLQPEFKRFLEISKFSGIGVREVSSIYIGGQVAYKKINEKPDEFVK